jgi:hypothetical protein
MGDLPRDTIPFGQVLEDREFPHGAGFPSPADLSAKWRKHLLRWGGG